MKRIFALMTAAIFALVLLIFSACDKAEDNSAKLEIVDDDGMSVYLTINGETDISKFTILRDDNSGDAVKKAASELRKKLKEKTSVALPMATTFSYLSGDDKCEIYIAEGEGYIDYEYHISSDGNRITVTGGSQDALLKAVDLLVTSYVTQDGAKLIFAEDYRFIDYYYVGNIAVDGVSLSEFAVCADPEDYAIVSPEVVTETLAAELGRKLVYADGEIPIRRVESPEEGGHYIILSAHSFDVDSYEIKIENGNIYVVGSVMSIDEAIDALIHDVLSATRYPEELGKKTVKLTSKNNVAGEIAFTVPYTKAELLEAFRDAYERDDMIISGTQTNNSRGTSNGIDIQKTVNAMIKRTGEMTALLEYDLGGYSSIYPNNEGKLGLSAYDISKLISDSAEHVALGGIIGISAHIENPRVPEEGCRSYIGEDATFAQIYTEGTELNANFMKSIEVPMIVLKAFSDNGIPVLFRPLHEMVAGWFWWGVNQNGHTLAPETWIGLWRYLHDYVEDTLGMDNILWTYSTPMSNPLYVYPGDEYTDLVGCDWYTGGNREVNWGNVYTDLMSTGKPVAITEFAGPNPNESGYDASNELDDLKWMEGEGYKVSYLLHWTTYGSYWALPDGDLYMQDELIYSRDEMLEYWKRNGLAE